MKILENFENFNSGEKTGSNQPKHDNYMFFRNIDHIIKMASEMKDMNEDSIDEMLTNGHDWANDHMAKAMESIDHVYKFLHSSIDDPYEFEDEMKNMDREKFPGEDEEDEEKNGYEENREDEEEEDGYEEEKDEEEDEE